MIKLENCEVTGWEHAIRGMRNPMNSWEKSDTYFAKETDPSGMTYKKVDTHEHTDWMSIGPNDHNLMMKLAKGGSVHAKYRRMITVYVDITAPLYWWKEFDTYKVGTVANSCSTMHKIHDKEFEISDFSVEHLSNVPIDIDLDHMVAVADYPNFIGAAFDNFKFTIDTLNAYRKLYLETKDKEYWWQMIQLLPSSYNQKRTVMLNYEVLVGIYEYRKNHKLDEWVEFCKWIETLPYSEIITGIEGCSKCKFGPTSCCDTCNAHDCEHRDEGVQHDGQND